MQSRGFEIGRPGPIKTEIRSIAACPFPARKEATAVRGRFFTGNIRRAAPLNNMHYNRNLEAHVASSETNVWVWR